MAVCLDLRLAELDQENNATDPLINLECGFFAAAVVYKKGKYLL